MIRAFTLMESLTTLFVSSFVIVIFAGSVRTTIVNIQDTIFFWEFEALYRDSQILAVNSQQEIQLQLTDEQLSNGYQSVKVPKGIDVVTERTIVFDKNGGNSSLAKLSFATENKTVSYQLYIGSGRYKKSEN